jgi:hypothetical protein
MATGGMPLAFIGAPGQIPASLTSTYSNFGYVYLSPAQPTFNRFSFNFDTDLGMLNPNTPFVTYGISLDIKRFVDYGHKIMWFHGLSDLRWTSDRPI